jgi:hypothetical protein
VYVAYWDQVINACVALRRRRLAMSPPPAFDPGRDIDGLDRRARSRTNFACGRKPGALFEVLGNRVWNEPGPNRIHVPVAIASLLMGIEAV